MAPRNSHHLIDPISRVKKSSPIAKSVFVCLRAADVFLQYSVLYRGWGIRFIEKLGGRAVHSSLVLNPLAVTGLQPYYGLVALLSLGSSLKQIAHMTWVSEQKMDVGTAASSLESKSFLDILSSPLINIGLTAYTVGLLSEAVSEFQRKAFKQDPNNKGKPYGGGLFSLATNINYGAYSTWRGAYALTCGGIVWGTTIFGFFFYDFATRGVPIMDEYMSQKYGEAYRQIKARVRYRLIPGVY